MPIISRLMKTKFASLLLALLALTFAGSALAVPPPGWTDDYTKALEKAKADKKSVLLDFTGSDWCPYCIKMMKDVLTQPKFKDFAKDNLVLVELDFPHSKPIPAHIKIQNKQLEKQFEVRGFPTFILVDGDGNKLWEHVGYMQGGPEAFVQAISSKTASKN
jgi:thioredoxin-related protein